VNRPRADRKKSTPAMKFVVVFIPILREMPEMMYKNDRDYYFDSSKINQRFSFTPTSYKDFVKQTVAAR
jgi:hypothetical protein